MILYKTKAKKLSGSSYGEMMRNAFAVFDEIKKKSKRGRVSVPSILKKKKYFLTIFGNICSKNAQKKE